MDIAFEQKVRERAYAIWVAAGMADGMEKDNWICAEMQLINEEAAQGKPAKARAKKAAAPTAKAKAPAKKTAAKAAKLVN